MKDNKLTAARVIMTLLTVAAIAAIFYNSSLNADDSAEQSFPLTEAFNDLLRSLQIPLILSENLVRKAAHFTEYSVLGVLLTTTYFLYIRRIRPAVIATLVSGAVVPICDELIQLSSEGRSCEARDMLIDFSGVVLACAVIGIILYARHREGRKKRE